MMSINIFITYLVVFSMVLDCIAAEATASALVGVIFKGEGQVDNFDISNNVVTMNLKNGNGRLQLKSSNPQSVGGCVKVYGNMLCNIASSSTLSLASLDNLQFYNCQQINNNGGAHECGLRGQNEGGDGTQLQAAAVMSPKAAFSSVQLGGANNNIITMDMRGVSGGSGGGNEFE